MRAVRRLRHWKQRFDKNAEFVWRKPVLWQGKQVTIGDKLPEELSKNPAKLRRFWGSGVIELFEFEAPDVATGQKKEPEKQETPPTASTEFNLEDSKPADLVTKNEEGRGWLVWGVEKQFSTKKDAVARAEEEIAKALEAVARVEEEIAKSLGAATAPEGDELLD